MTEPGHDLPPLTDLTDADLAEIERLIAAADLTEQLHLSKHLDHGGDLVCVLDDGTGVEARIYVEETADLILAVLNALPRLVAALRAAREDVAVHHADDAAVSRVLAAALGDRFSPDGPPADAVGLLVGERDRLASALTERTIERDLTEQERQAISEELMSTRTERVELIRERDQARTALAAVRGECICDTEQVDVGGYYAAKLNADAGCPWHGELAEARAALARAEQATRVVVVLDLRKGCVYSITTDNEEARRHVRELVAKYDNDQNSATMTVGLVGGALAADVPAAPDSPATADHETHPAGEEKP